MMLNNTTWLFTTLLLLLLLAVVPKHSHGFRAIFQRRRQQHLPPSTRRANVDIELLLPGGVTTKQDGHGLLELLPDVSPLFESIQRVSPLAKLAIEQERSRSTDFVSQNTRGFAALPPDSILNTEWKTIEVNRRGPVTCVERIDNFNELAAPLLRFRGTLDGPCEADPLASLIMDVKERRMWDVQIDDVFETHKIQDLPSVNAAMGFAYGTCYRLGIGYCRTKKNLGIDAREQLTVCGINKFSNGCSMIWGVELPER
jgi:hypothetical protein